MTCTKCSSDGLSAADFYKSVRRPSGLTVWCKCCMKSSSKRGYVAGSKRYSSLGTYGVSREKRWLKERPRRLLLLHERLGELDLAGKSDEYDLCCWEIEDILVERGELKYRGV